MFWAPPGTCTQIGNKTIQTWQMIGPIQPAAMVELVQSFQPVELVELFEIFEIFEIFWTGGGWGGPPLSQPAGGRIRIED